MQGRLWQGTAQRKQALEAELVAVWPSYLEGKGQPKFTKAGSPSPPTPPMCRLGWWSQLSAGTLLCMCSSRGVGHDLFHHEAAFLQMGC